MLSAQQIDTLRAAVNRIIPPADFPGGYSDPGNGGNRDQIAWKMIGFDTHDIW